MTPLIDVVFILLLFFMLASNFNRLQSTPLQLSGAGAPIQTQANDLVLRIRADGSLLIAGKLSDRRALTQSIRERSVGDISPGAVITPERDVSLQTLTLLLDELRALGVVRINLVAD